MTNGGYYYVLFDPPFKATSVLMAYEICSSSSTLLVNVTTLSMSISTADRLSASSSLEPEK